jgi:hypothetical protein
MNVGCMCPVPLELPPAYQIYSNFIIENKYLGQFAHPPGGSS